jgi:hypothetical protein
MTKIAVLRTARVEPACRCSLTGRGDARRTGRSRRQRTPNHHRVRPIARPSIQPAPPYWSPNRSCQTPSTSPTQAHCCGQIAVTLTRNSLARLPQVRSSEASGRRPPARGCSIARRPPKPFTMSATGSLITASRKPPFVHRHLAQFRRTLHLRYPAIFHRD